MLNLLNFTLIQPLPKREGALFNRAKWVCSTNKEEEMKIRTMEEAEAARDLIGNQNVEACGRALADNAQVWFFQTEEEIEDDPELIEKEKKECKRILREEGLGYAGWVRPPEKRRRPTPEQILMGAAGSSDHDSHGNRRSQGGSHRGKWSH